MSHLNSLLNTIDPNAPRLRAVQESPISEEDAFKNLRYEGYDDIADEEERKAVQRAAVEIQGGLKRAARDLFIIGQRLIFVKEKLPHGQWSHWLDEEFGLSDRMARNFMHVARRLGPKTEKFSVLAPSALYELAAPSTDAAVIERVEARIDQDDPPTLSEVRDLKSRQQEEEVARSAALAADIRAWLEAQGLSLAERIATLRAIQEKAPNHRYAELADAVPSLPNDHDDGLQVVARVRKTLERDQARLAVADREAAALRQALTNSLDQLQASPHKRTFKHLTGDGPQLRRAIQALEDALAALDASPSRDN